MCKKIFNYCSYETVIASCFTINALLLILSTFILITFRCNDFSSGSTNCILIIIAGVIMVLYIIYIIICIMIYFTNYCLTYFIERD
jgi:hypothetical protein